MRPTQPVLVQVSLARVLAIFFAMPAPVADAAAVAALAAVVAVESPVPLLLRIPPTSGPDLQGDGDWMDVEASPAAASKASASCRSGMDTDWHHSPSVTVGQGTASSCLRRLGMEAARGPDPYRSDAVDAAAAAAAAVAWASALLPTAAAASCTRTSRTMRSGSVRRPRQGCAEKCSGAAAGNRPRSFRSWCEHAAGQLQS
mmetsp:Transcript_32229/g.92764  ORF Transcript_32229/g.92764 Transcript_32229/m.92764 type:complete len:201 (+) Transcript_32229:493-1095(+)